MLCYCLLLSLIIAYVFSSTKLEIRAGSACKWGGGWWLGERGKGPGGRNGPNNACTCNQMDYKIPLKNYTLNAFSNSQGIQFHY
jgi:hypothetical protein